MYKITSVTDKSGNIKQDFIDNMKLKHGEELRGDFYYLYMLKSGVANGTSPHCCFIWADDSDKMMRTSRVQSMSEWDEKIKIVTMNSVYVFEKVE